MNVLIVLISGTGVRSDLKLIKYWGNIPRLLESYGYKVLLLHPDAFGSISKNVEIVKDCLRKTVEEVSYDKVHIIGHSRGGIEALCMNNDILLRNHISSITLLNSPITGHNLAKSLSNKNVFIKKFIISVLNFIGRIQGDKYPDSEKLIYELSKNHLSIANEHTKAVLHFVQSKLKYKELPFFWKLVSLIFYKKNRVGDGFVEYQNLNGSNIKEIPLELLSNQIVTHNSAIGLPNYLRHSKVEIKSFWHNLIRYIVK